MKQYLIVKPGCIGLKAAALSLILSAQAASAFAADDFKAIAKEISTATGAFLTSGDEAVVKALFISSAVWTQIAAPLVMEDADMEDLRDSLAETRCTDAPERVDSLESQILDLKARYWALQIKKGINMENIRHNLGSIITDALLKQEFYDLMRMWLAQRDIPELNAYEVTQFVEADQEAFTLHRECGL